MLPSWLANFRLWQRLIHDLEEDKVSDVDGGKYQRLVMANRQLLGEMDDCYERAKQNLRKSGIDFSNIDSKSAAKVLAKFGGSQGQ